MNRLSLSKSMAFVFFFVGVFGSVLTFAVTQAQCESAGGSYNTTTVNGVTTTGCVEDWLHAQCVAAIKKFSESRAKFVKACRDNGMSISDCGTTLDDCSQDMVEETGMSTMMSGMMSGLMGGAGNLLTTPNKCSAYSYTDYKSELRDLDRAKKDAERDVRDLNKDNQKQEENYEKDKARIQKEFVDDQEKRSEDQMKETEEERNAVAQEAESTNKLKEQLAELNSLILRTQSEKALLIKTRASNVDNYKIELIKCKSQTREFEKSIKSTGSNGSFQSANARSASNKNDIQTFWETCISKVLSQRDAEAEAFRAKLSEYDDTIAKTTEKLNQVSASIQLLSQQAAQAKNDRSVKRTKAEEAFQKRQMASYQALVSLDQQMTQKRVDIQNSLSQAKMAVIEQSNQLASLQAEKPRSKGSKSLADASEAMETYAGESCESACETSPKLKSQCQRETKAQKNSSGAGGAH